MDEALVGRRRAAKVGVGFVVALVLLYLFGRVVGWGTIVDTLGRADPALLALAFVSTTVGLVVWSKAWDELLALADVDIPFRALVVIYFAATFADYVTPFGKAGGGPLIAYVLSTDERAAYHESLASVTTADLLNLLPFFAFAAVGFAGLVVRGGLPGSGRVLLAGLAGFAVLLVAAVAVGWRYRGVVESGLVRLLSPLARRVSFLDASTVREEIRGFYEAVGRFRDHPRVLAYTLTFSVVGWVCFVAPLYLAARTLGVPVHPVVVLFVVPVSTMAGFVPTPGGLGGVEVALTGLLLALLPVSGGTAAAITLVYRVASYWLVVLLGGLAAFYVIYRS